MRQLPCYQQIRQKPTPDVLFPKQKFLPSACGGGLSCCCCPAHKGGDSAYDGTDPGVEDGDSFKGCVDSGVEEDVEAAEEGDGRIDAVVKGPDSNDAGGDGEDCCAAGGDQSAY